MGNEKTVLESAMEEALSLARAYQCHLYDQAQYITTDGASVTFKIQDGPQKENGVNGCQIEHLLVFVLGMIRELNSNYPCRQNSLVITKIEEAIHWMEDRRNDRVSSGVEGYNKPFLSGPWR